MNLSPVVAANIQVNGNNYSAAENVPRAKRSLSELYHHRYDCNVTENKYRTADVANMTGTHGPPIDGAAEAANFDRRGSLKETVRTRKTIVSGIVLNPSQVYSPKDIKWLSDNQITNDIKDQELMQNHMISSTDIFTVDKTLVITSQKEQDVMSLGRKFAFSLSFLPALAFVLFFTIILPCEKLDSSTKFCVTPFWNLILNDSELTTDLEVSGGLLFAGFSKDGEGILSKFNSEEAAELWNVSVPSAPRHISCKHFDANADGIDDCLLLDTFGVLYAFNISDGYMFWKFSIDGETLWFPMVLNDCNSNGVNKVAVVTSRSKIVIVNNGREMTRLTLEDCASTPANLHAWNRGGRTDLAFVCATHNGAGTVRVIEQKDWCVTKMLSTVETLDLLGSHKFDAKHTLLLPTEDGLIVWAERLVLLFGNNRSEIWSTRTQNYSHRRFLAYGHYLPKQKQVALIRTMETNGTVVSFLSSEDGTEVSSWRSPMGEVKNAISVPSGTESYLLLLIQINQTIDLKENETLHKEPDKPTNGFLEYLNNSTPWTYSSKSSVNSTSKWQMIFLHSRKGDASKIEARLLFTENQGPSQEQTEAFKIAADVQNKDHKRSLVVYLGRNFFSLPSELTLRSWAELQSIKVEDWDTSEKKSSSCEA